MERLYCVHASSRRIFGDPEPRAPSRFISEIPNHLIRHVDRYHSPFFETEPAYGAASEDSLDYYVGQIVDHSQFGRGKVTKISSRSEHDAYITVRFSRTGMTKKFASSFAPLTIYDE